ncbi:MAG: aquaporin [SAR324 cluster bacterium]|nr:aquaporin [SAR324 cluster bacterium]
MSELFKNNKNAFFAEMLGTFALVLIGAGSVIVENHTGMSHLGLPDGKVRLIGIAFAHGLTLMAMIFALGSISGAHFNPAVSMACWLQKRLKKELFYGYMIAQFTGAMLASLILAGLFPDEIELARLGSTFLAPNISAVKGLFFEGLITFMLVITVLFVTRENNPSIPFAAIAIGMTLTGLILFAGPMTGAAANPVRYLGPAIVSMKLDHYFSYLVGQFLGAMLAAIAYSFCYGVSPLTESEEELDRRENEEKETKDSSDESSENAGASVNYSGPNKSQVQNAYQLFKDEEFEEADKALKKLLTDFDQSSPEVQKRILTLKVIFEEEMGKQKEAEEAQQGTKEPGSEDPSEVEEDPPTGSSQTGNEGKTPNRNAPVIQKRVVRAKTTAARPVTRKKPGSLKQ